MSDDIIRELEEEMRAAKLARLWKRYGATLIAASVCIVLGTAAGEMWKSHQRSQREQLTGGLVQALDAHKDAGLAEILHMHNPTPQAALAGLYLGSQQQPEQAEGTYRAVQSLAHKEGGLRALAGVLAVHMALEQGHAPDAISVQAGAPFALQAREAQAWADTKRGAPDKAKAQFAALADDASAPESLRQRARMMAAYLEKEQ